jgi:hypothetical protein
MRRIPFILLIILLSLPAFALLHGGSNTCPYGSSISDGCGASPGLYFSPWTSPANPLIPVPQPSASQFSSYARQSGQVWSPAWTRGHTPSWNLAGIDYGVGPDQLVSSMTDIASWTQGTDNCVYMSAADGYSASNTGAAVSFTANYTGTTLTVTGGTAPNPGMALVPVSGAYPTGIGAGTIILSGGPTTFTLNKAVSTETGKTVDASNTWFGNNGATFDWVQNYPVFLCTGSSATNFTISGWNFGETQFQGTPNGTHGCVGVVFLPSSTAYTPQVTINNNAFISGSTCGPVISSTTFGQIYVAGTMLFQPIIYNNFVWGRNTNSCCIVGLSPLNNGVTNGGVFFETGSSEASQDIEYNFFYQVGSIVESGGWITGNEANQGSCSNGTIYNAPGYSMNFSHNYIDNFGEEYGAGHFEITNIGTGVNSPGICKDIKDYNVINVPGTMPNSTTGPFFGFGASTASGVLEYGEVKNNLFTSNLVGGRQVVGSVIPYEEYYNWHTDGGSPVNHVIVTGQGTNCSNSPVSSWGCLGPVQGQGIAGGTNNFTGAQVGLQALQSGVTYPYTLNAGCNQQDGTQGTCQHVGNYPALTVGQLFPTWTGNVAASGGPFTGTTITLLSAQCPASAGGAIVTDTTQSGAAVGTVSTCSGTTLTLTGNTSTPVQNSDALLFTATNITNALFSNNIESVAGAEYGHGSSTLGTWTAGTTSGNTINIGASNTCPVNGTAGTVAAAANVNNARVFDMSQSGALVGVIESCTTGVSITLYGAPLITVTSSDILAVRSFAYGEIVYSNNYLDGVGATPVGVPIFWKADPALIQAGGYDGISLTVASSGGPFTGTTVTLSNATSCPAAAASSGYGAVSGVGGIVTDGGSYVGTLISCSGSTLTFTANVAVTVNDNDPLTLLGSGGCAVTTTLTGNIDLTGGTFGGTPNTLATRSGGC